mgnify:CR=1 FL=1
MRILIYGAGAIGGYIGGSLISSGESVVLVARGDHYKKIYLNLQRGNELLRLED